jgi:hypothetical protein
MFKLVGCYSDANHLQGGKEDVHAAHGSTKYESATC